MKDTEKGIRSHQILDLACEKEAPHWDTESMWILM